MWVSWEGTGEPVPPWAGAPRALLGMGRGALGWDCDRTGFTGETRGCEVCRKSCSGSVQNLGFLFGWDVGERGCEGQGCPSKEEFQPESPQASPELPSATKRSQTPNPPDLASASPAPPLSHLEREDLSPLSLQVPPAQEGPRCLR